MDTTFRVFDLAIVAVAASVLTLVKSSVATDQVAPFDSALPSSDHVEATRAQQAGSLSGESDSALLETTAALGLGSILAGDSTVAMALAAAPSPAAPAGDRDAPIDFEDLTCPLPGYTPPHVPQPLDADALYDECMDEARLNWVQEYEANIVPLYQDVCDLDADYLFLQSRINAWVPFYYLNQALCNDGDPISCVTAQVLLDNITAAEAEQRALIDLIDGYLEDALDEFERLDALFLIHAADCLEELANRNNAAPSLRQGR